MERPRGGIDAFWVLLTETKLLGKQHYESSRYEADPKIVSGDVSEDAQACATGPHGSIRYQEVLKHSWIKPELCARWRQNPTFLQSWAWSVLTFVKCHRSSTFFRHLMILRHRKKAKQRASFTAAPLKTQGTKSVPDMWERTNNC